MSGAFDWISFCDTDCSTNCSPLEVDLEYTGITETKYKQKEEPPMIKHIRTALTAALIALTIAFSAGALDGFLPTAYATPHVLAGGGQWSG
jgi:hypothetical protein